MLKHICCILRFQIVTSDKLTPENGPFESLQSQTLIKTQ